MERLITIVAGTAVGSGILILLGWFVLPVRVGMLVGTTLLLLPLIIRGSKRGWLRRSFIVDRASCITAVLALTIAALLILHASATTAPLRSPWSAVPSAFFVLYALLAGAAVFLAFRESRGTSVGIACAVMVGSAVAILVYPLGFGFDHFIHAAAEHIIVDTGALTPRPYFYSAHYGLVALLATLAVPSALADRILVPLLTVALLVPLAVRALGNRGALVLLLIPFLPLAVSTPQSTANVFALTTVLLSLRSPSRSEAIPAKEVPRQQRPRRRGLAMMLCCAASLLSNPLTGIPLTGAVVAVLFARARQRTLAAFSGIVGAVGIPVALMIAARMNSALDLRIGFSSAPLRSGLLSLRDAVVFHATDFATADAIAIARITLPLLWILLAVLGACSVRSRPASFVIPPFVALLAALAVACTTTLSTQLAEEQSQLPLRLLQLAVILSIPLVARAASHIAPLSIKSGYAAGAPSHLQRPATAFVLAALATFTLVLTYPRDDAQARSGLWSVSADDIAAVHAIAADAGEKRYVVLANQMLGAAAIQEFGFRPSMQSDQGEMLSFPLPAGGPIAQQFWNLVSTHTLHRSSLNAAMRLVSADRAYVVLHDYWRSYERLTTATAEIADDEIGSFQHLRIFRFVAETP